MTSQDFTSLLRNAGLKATPGRLAVLKVFSNHSTPLSVRDLKKNIKVPMDEVTLYRTINTLREKDILRSVDLLHDHNHYELNNHNHHHLVCKQCSKVVNIPDEDVQIKINNILKQTKFATVDDQSLELFGICTSCHKNRRV